MSPLSRRLIRSMTALTLAGAALALAQPALAGGEARNYLTKAEIQSSLIGKGILSKNLASGKLSHWEFHPDGRVEAVSRNGLGSASGTWAIRDDGQMCVTMLSRTGCRYWFRQGGAFANADSNQPDAQTVAEVRFD